MRTQKIDFSTGQVLCVFPQERTELGQAISEMQLNDSYPVIVLIGGEIDEQHADVTQRAIATISKIADQMKALIICGGTDMGIMAEIGQIRSKNGYTFPLVGITPEKLVTWADGPQSTNFLWWGEKRLQLEPHCTHFILVPGDKFGNESAWMVDTATLLSKNHGSVTILINGGDVSLKDIELSLAIGRPVIALSRTGRLADNFARQPERNKLITVIPAHAEQRIMEAVQAAISPQVRIVDEKASPTSDRIRS